MGIDKKTVSIDGKEKEFIFDALNINIYQTNESGPKISNEPNHANEETNLDDQSQEKQDIVSSNDTIKIPLKSRYLAAFLACSLGRFGIHKFYLKKPMQGTIYLLLSTTQVSFILGLLEGVIYLLTDKDTWMKQVGFIEK